jgi:hypothetical protein
MSIRNNNELTPAQFAAIRAAEALAKDIAASHPEIVDLYRNGVNQAAIAALYQVEDLAGSRKIAHMAVHLAIKSLLPDDEREAITRSLRQQMGAEMVASGVGIHGMSPEQRREIGLKVLSEKKGVHALTHEEHQRNGLIAREMHLGVHAWTDQERMAEAQRQKEAGLGLSGMSLEKRRQLGKALHQAGIGIHSMTAEERRRVAMENVRKRKGIHGMTQQEREIAYRKSVLARGAVPWSDEEKTVCLEALQDPANGYLYKGRFCVNTAAIAEMLNQRFHEGQRVRDKSSVNFMRFPRKRKRA